MKEILIIILAGIILNLGIKLYFLNKTVSIYKESYNKSRQMLHESQNDRMDLILKNFECNVNLIVREKLNKYIGDK